jgi:regulator of ribonuclease activity A
MILFNTADICDKNNNIQIGDPIFKSYGKNKKFCGMIRTVTAIEDNSYVKKLVEEKVDGDVMVVEGKASTKCALLGDNLAMKAFENGWSGFIINGCIRDSEIINNIPIGIKAINTMPIKSQKNNIGEYSKALNFANIDFQEGEYVYSDPDGIIVLKDRLVSQEKLTNNGLIPYVVITYTKIYSNG